jgi:ADP-ribose pyrophosphatase
LPEQSFPRILSRKITRISPFVKLIEKSVQFAEGAEPELYHFVGQSDYVHVFAQTSDGMIPVVRQYRPCVEDFTWEFPAGTVDAGEQPEQAARRELFEEAGLSAVEIIDLGSYYPDTGRVQVLSHAFYARCGEPVPGHSCESEGLTVRYVTHAELKAMIVAGEFRHQLHVALYAAALVRGIDLG